jgi:hypothetical protein
MVKYKKLIENNQFKTGDLLLFNHKDNLSSCSECFFSCFTDLIKFFTNSKYSHAAIIIEGSDAIKMNLFPGIPSIGIERYYVLQSSYEPFPDAEDNQLKLGVEIVSFSKLVSTFYGEIYWRHINCLRNDSFLLKLIQAHSVVHNRPYDMDPYDWIRAAFKIEVGPTHRLDKFWCSALVAYVYAKLGLLPENTNWTLVSPVMLSQISMKPTFINCTIDDEIRIL